uniref:CPL2 n=1 Tax=Arundo donax TaxID=35708 RepID=A0A0A9DN77_ARUDO
MQAQGQADTSPPKPPAPASHLLQRVQERSGSDWRRGAALSGNADQGGESAVLLVLFCTCWALCSIGWDAQPALPCHCV